MPSRSFGAADTTIRRYLEILESTFMVRLLRPWHETLGKRQVKAPKLYLRDPGLFHSLLGIGDHEMLLRHPKLGPSWEGFALEEVLRILAAEPNDAYFWATHAGAELDLLVHKDGKRLGCEIKYTDLPRLTKSMRTVMVDLHLDQLFIVHPGERGTKLADNIRMLGLASTTTLL